jgi:hypothetical protein
MEQSTRSPGDAGTPNLPITVLGAVIVIVSVLFSAWAGMHGDVVAALSTVPIAVAGILLVGVGSRPSGRA